MRFVVFGAGAIGTGIGGHLHRTEHDTLIVGRPAHVNRIRQHGLQLITDQQTYAGDSGLYVGGYQVLGHPRPGVAGILTSQINKEQTSVRAYGWFGGVEGQPTLTLVTDSPSGQQRIILRLDGPDRLVGTGNSSFKWGPTGPIELRRAP